MRDAGEDGGDPLDVVEVPTRGLVSSYTPDTDVEQALSIGDRPQTL